MSDLESSEGSVSRYLVHEVFAKGGVGAVHSALDRALHREVAYKVLLPHRSSDSAYRIRFVREARLSAQLQHPNILPVYDLGMTPEGVLFFAMKRVHGRSLDTILRGLRLGQEDLEERFPLPRLLTMFGQLCQAVHYAHTRGVLHRDLKPANIMVGALGEVLLMDWGLAKRIEPLRSDDAQLFEDSLEPLFDSDYGQDAAELDGISANETGRLIDLLAHDPINASTVDLPPARRTTGVVRLDKLDEPWAHSSSDPTQSGDLLGETGEDAGIYETAIGRVLGTPAHMAPEQARGNQLDVRADIYALGTILYEVLALRPAFAGRDSRRVMLSVTRGRYRKPSEIAPSHRPVPALLEEMCLRAMSLDPDDRHPTAWDLLLELERYQQGSEEQRRNAEAADLAVEEALKHERLWKQAHADYVQARERATTEAAGLRISDPIETKRAAWEAEDAAEALARESERSQAVVEQLLREALRKQPDHEAAKRALAQHTWRRLQEAERRSDSTDVVRYEEELRAIGDRRWAPLLGAPAMLQVDTDPPGASVTIAPLVEADRQLVAGPVVERFVSPGDEVPLPPGRYEIRANLPGRAPVLQTVRLGRGERRNMRLRLFPESSLPRGYALIPGGNAVLGGDAIGMRALRSVRAHLPDFAMQRLPVTMSDYLTFLHDLPPDDAWARAPRDEPEAGQLLARGPDGKLALPSADGAGHEWHPQLPVMAVSFNDAVAYAEWMTRKDGIRYRLPTDAEWEYAARSPDGRIYPWGDRWVAGYALVLGTLGTAPQPQPVGWSKTDINAYGIHDLAGGSRDWCDGWKSAGKMMRLLRGGAWWDRPDHSRLTVRSGWPAPNTFGGTGIRLVCSMPPERAGPALLQDPEDPRYGGVRTTHLPAI